MQLRQAIGSIVDARARMRSAWADSFRSPDIRAPVEGFATPAPAHGEGKLPVALTASALQVLLVDDSPTNRQDARDLLSQWGIVPTMACDGSEALALAGKRHFDIIIMDIAMPVMDGLQATQRIRQLETEHADWPRTPIVAYTTGDLLANTALQARVGFDQAIQKPCSAGHMEACLRRWCSSDILLLSSRRDGIPAKARD